MKKFLLTILFLQYIAFTICVGQKQEVYPLFKKFQNQYLKGDLVNAEKTLYQIIPFKDSITEGPLGALYNNLGVINQLLGKYDIALTYFGKAEEQLNKNINETKELADIYNNKAFIFNIQGVYDQAIEYLEKSIRVYSKIGLENKSVFQSLSSVYLNIGIAYFETGDYRTALRYYKESEQLKVKNNLPGLLFVYPNIAKAYERSGNLKYAEKFYLKSISESEKQFGNDYFNLAEVYIDYSLFLRSAGRNDESLNTLNKALNVSIKNFGEKHPLVSMTFKHIGDHYRNISDYGKALEYYQKALSAIVNDFNYTDVLSNPAIDSTLLDIRLLDNLKSKAQVLELLATRQPEQSDKIRMLTASLQTMELAIQLIDKIRHNYPSEESRIYLAENEKESYIFATHLACTLSQLTKDDLMVERIYNIAKKGKAAILRNEIASNQLLNSSGVPDSLLEKLRLLSGNIASYNHLVFREINKKDPDTIRLMLWKDDLFSMKRMSEKINEEINRTFPKYNELIQRTNPISLNDLQKKLRHGETVIDYLLSNHYVNGQRILYTFVVSKDNLKFYESALDSAFLLNAETIRQTKNSESDATNAKVRFKKYSSALYYMYEHLLKPIESDIKGKNLIIIPDEEISWLPFDAFIKNLPSTIDPDYESLDYLIYDYTISYGYTSSLIFSKNKRINNWEVYSYSPEYGKKGSSGQYYSSLNGAEGEIESIHKLFNGKKFSGENATKEKFLESTSKPAIFHLAMHARTDSSDSKYSYFVFEDRDSPGDGRLYNYEISLCKINSPMVVMSACNSGSGNLYQGEGLISLARGFILAGASSVIKTAWNVNDEVSASIISRFYSNLSKGLKKDEALRKAKLEYLNNSAPSFKDPYYWAAYELMGDNSSVTWNRKIIIPVCILIIAGILFYLRRRRISSERSA